ncbi:hypothetical protein Q5P01_013938 [Channa striata]|uniref:Uncharacterized protein n=1 Tax=Channa striata TaxID=64152 RepID=A0AA88ML00_CHASR|nr:hypothetical protein Q5P01_013938 [Channa striata]
MNVGPNKSVFSCSSTNQTGPWGSERRFYRAAVLCLGLLSFFLLTGLTGLGVHLHRAEADFSIIKANILNAEKDRLSSLNAEKEQMVLPECREGPEFCLSSREKDCPPD